MTRLRQAFAFLLAAGACASAQAQERAPVARLPVARVTIYPGDEITDAMLDERADAISGEEVSSYIRSREGLVGKVARRTLLRGEPIPTLAVDNPRLVRVGAQVKVVYADGGLQIVTYGVAQQAGAVGDIIRVRNQDSGLFVSGRVQNDGSIRVGAG